VAKSKKTYSNRLDCAFQPAVTREEMETMLEHMLRLPSFFELALDSMTSIDTKELDNEVQARVFACRRLRNIGITPADQGFRTHVKQQLRLFQNQSYLVEEEIEGVQEMVEDGGFIDQVFQRKRSDFSEEVACEVLSRWLKEVNVMEPLRQVFSDSPAGQPYPQDFAAILTALQSRMHSIERLNGKSMKTVGDDWAEHELRLNQLRGRELLGLKTGQAELDRRLRGLRGFTLLGAKPGAGKTTWAAVEIALGVCRNFEENSCVVIVLSLDMNRFDLISRIHSSLADMDWSTLTFGSPKQTRAADSSFSKNHQLKLDRASQRLDDWQIGNRLAILDRDQLGDNFTVAQIRGYVEELKKKANAERALIIVDYLQLWPLSEEIESSGDLAADRHRVRMVQQLIENTRSETDPIGDTVLVISEARKPPSKKEIWGDSLSELMGSARLGYAADAVILYREMTLEEIKRIYRGIADEKAADRKRTVLREAGIVPIMLILEKGRDGMTRGTWAMEFLFRRSKFREVQGRRSDALIPPGATGSKGRTSPNPEQPAAVPSVVPVPPAGPGSKSKKKSTVKGNSPAKNAKSK